MMYNHFASEILKSSKKDPTMTDLHVLQLLSGHAQM